MVREELQHQARKSCRKNNKRYMEQANNLYFDVSHAVTCFFRNLAEVAGVVQASVEENQQVSGDGKAACVVKPPVDVKAVCGEKVFGWKAICGRKGFGGSWEDQVCV